MKRCSTTLIIREIKTIMRYHLTTIRMAIIKQTRNNNCSDFPGGPVVKIPPFNAGDEGSIPGQGTNIPHAMGQLSPCAATTEPCTMEPVCRN